MSSIIIQFIPLAAAAIAPVMVIAVIILLSLDKGLKKCLAFIVGRIICYAVWAVLLIFVFGLIEEEATESSVVNLSVKIILGGFLLILAFKNILEKKGKGNKQPKWMAKINKAKPLALFGIGFLLSVVQIRYVALMMAGLTIISSVQLPIGLLIFAIVILIFTVVWIQILPIIIYIVMGKRAKIILEQFKRWLVHHQNKINFIVLVSFGIILLWQGISGLL